MDNNLDINKKTLHSLVSFFQSDEHQNSVYLNNSSYSLMSQAVNDSIKKYIDYPFIKNHIKSFKTNFANLNQRHELEVFFNMGAHCFIERLIKILCRDQKTQFLIDPLSHKTIENPINYECTYHQSTSTYLKFDSLGFICLNHLKSSLSKDITAVFINQCSNINGLKQNALEIEKVISEYNYLNKTNILLIVDASQSYSKTIISEQAGDIYFFAQQKSFALPGCAIFIKEETQKKLCLENDLKKANFLLSNVIEAGTPHFLSILSIIKSGEFLVELDQGFHIKGFSRFEHLSQLTKYTYKKLKEIKKIKFLGLNDQNINDNLSILSFCIEGKDLVKIATELKTFGIHVQAAFMDEFDSYFCIPNSKNIYQCLNEKQSIMRISLQWYNTKSDIERFFKFFNKYL
ncbi:MAG: hypothetical protein COB02_16445 [Candidatus Cloacimonadota bacterium]|nr:MAG: hypothetical protein COB02_16445 [Candidatus Cloacimonadota bacterium]